MSSVPRRSPVPVALVLVLAAALSGCTQDRPGSPVAPPSAPASTSSAAAPRAPLGVGDATPPKLRFSACGGKFRCATARVPLDYRDPAGATVNLAVTVLPAAKDSLGPLFVNFGGPGTPAVGELQEHAYRYPSLLRQRFDLVAFDPRGVGASTPLRCGSAALPAPVGSPIRATARFFASATIPGKRCAKRSSALMAHMSTANTARDMELLRRALGGKPANLLGYSYGSYLGGTYANLFPAHTRAMVLDGTLDLVANSTGAPGTQNKPVDVRADVAGSQAAELDRFFALCRAARGTCAFAAGDPKAKFARMFAALRAGKGGPAGLANLVQVTVEGLESQSNWPYLAQSLQGIYAATPRASGGERTLDPYVDGHSAGFLATQCVDSDNPADPQSYVDLAAAEDTRRPYFGPSAVFDMAACVGWPARDADRYLGPWNARRQLPILIVNNRYDPATPLANAQATARELGNAGVLVVEGHGHTSLNVPSRCAATEGARYLVSGTLPTRRSCPPDTRPF